MRMIDYCGVPVIENRLVPLFREADDGERVPILAFVVCGKVLVHPDRWEEFALWVAAPDVADHPELRAWFRARDAERAGHEAFQSPSFRAQACGTMLAPATRPPRCDAGVPDFRRLLMSIDGAKDRAARVLAGEFDGDAIGATQIKYALARDVEALVDELEAKRLSDPVVNEACRRVARQVEEARRREAAPLREALRRVADSPVNVVMQMVALKALGAACPRRLTAGPCYDLAAPGSYPETHRRTCKEGCDCECHDVDGEVR